MFRTREQWVTLLEQMKLLWTHDGNSKRPHAELTSGGHSDGFFNGGKLLFDYPRLAREMAQDLMDMSLVEVVHYASGQDSVGLPIKRVIGPAFGAITWADKIADALDIGCAFTIPDGEGVNKKFKLEKRFDIKGELVLPVEDVLTTGDSVSKTIEVALASGAMVAPFIVAICNRSGLREIGGRQILSMVDKRMTNWTLEECPLCKAGSKAIRPKEAQNWALLSAQY
jgi:orotate phosphoribosyltransferase